MRSRKMRLKSVWIIAFVAISAMAFVGCEDEVPQNYNPNAGNNNGGGGGPVIVNNTIAKINSIKTRLSPKEQSFSMDATSYQTVTSNNGNMYSFAPNSFVDAMGNDVTGNVDVKIIEIRNGSDIYGSGVTTISGNSLLSSAGMFKIEVSQGGNPVDLKSNTFYNVSFKGPKDKDPDMRLFKGVPTGDQENVIRWEEDNDGWILDDSTQGGGKRDSLYNFQINFLSWCNLDKYYSNGNLTKLEVVLPDEHNNTNTSVFLFIEDDNGAVSLYGDPVSKVFNTGGYSIPIGLKVKIIVGSQMDGKILYNITSVDVTDNHSEVINQFTEATESEFETILKNL